MDGKRNLMDEVNYGPFHGGDPRLFQPDEECCTAEEMARWKDACAAWDRGEGEEYGPECQTLGNGAIVKLTGFGIGLCFWSQEAKEWYLSRIGQAPL